MNIMIEHLREKIGPEVKENEVLAPYTTFKIGGPAQYFVEVGSRDKLHKVLSVAVELKLPYFFLGGGSNLLISDDGIEGLVIRFVDGPIEIKGQRVTVFAGNNWKNFVREVVKAELGGLVPCGNIPGTVGGALRGNAGAYGVDNGQFVKQVEALVVGKEEVSLNVLSKEECRFSYRESIFKREPSFVVSEVTYEFPPLEGTVEDTLAEIDKEMATRNEKHPMDFPNAGSTFKNVIYSDDVAQYKEWEKYGKIPAFRFIEAAGLKGMKIGGAQVSEKHCNFIVNTGDATADDVIQLISMVKMKVRDQMGVQLMEELQYIGFN
jgi:UDP-N-acetylmuramate dehydrogenase